MKFPYGISDFNTLIMEKYHYVDRTNHIPLLEEAGKQLLFLRPRRFGKSLLLSMLENYYDLNKADQFHELFGHLAIGKNPTAEHNRYFVLRWDFSGVSPIGNGEEIKRNLYDYLNGRIGKFSTYYRETLSEYPIQVDRQNALASFQSLLNAVQEIGHSLYLFIDEYDNFANELMMGHRPTEESRYQAILSGEGCMKALFKTVKMAAGEGAVGRVFITGVSPVAMSDLTSAYNVAENIYLLPQFNELCGFREAEIADVLATIAEECDLTESQADEALSMMRTFYNGYRFSSRTEELVYNPTLAMYFLKAFQRDCRYPDRILDSNLAMDRGKMHYISRLPEGRQLIFDALGETEPVAIFELADRFGVEDMLYAPKDTTFVASLLYYFGVLTQGGVTPFGELILTIPNLVIRKLYAESIREMLLPEGKAKSRVDRVVKALYQRGDIQPLCDFMERKYFKVFSNRDYAHSNELTIKTAFLTLLFGDTLYIMESEAEIQRGHTDLTMIVRPDMRQYQVSDILIEFKFVSLQEAGMDGKAVEQISDETLRALSAVQAKQQEAKAGLARYRSRLNRKFGDVLRLKSFSVVAVGFERLVSEVEA
uniref:PD-(D/E)XK nuclease superfamily protein n=1 Tax=Candidatus Kentrum sp. MB TaxID=2138164 RepID=A0A450Y380_9GAMM|nr:MAG: PD-(D/E)XK nuclease superfamily protein [Candidatus Kentron sp. MB]VFK35995.1 MAG: PD-(D/E)XK nuclease superfamily protein [Candidatus Kentron sp. MB]VFK77589.1 MAG: PD-(D/E)XK nuclease superfamily protein [Candidatus Kentron sp. MB]